MESVVLELIDILFARYPMNLTKCEEYLTYNRHYFTPERLTKMVWTSEFAEKNNYREHQKFFSEADKVNISLKVCQGLLKKYLARKSKKKAQKLTLAPKELSDRKILFDTQSNRKYFLSPDGKILRENYAHWELVMKKILGEEGFSDYFVKNIIYKKLIYDPYETPGEADHPRHGESINLFDPPEWLEDPIEKGDIKLDPRIEEFIDHFFADEESKEYALLWCHGMLTRKNMYSQVLVGAKGIGKGIWCDLNIALVGSKNYFEAPKSFFTSNFNQYLATCQFFFLDETTITGDNRELLKRFMNDRAALETKNLSIEETVDINANFMISNNSILNIKLEDDDRRFSVPMLTEKNYAKLRSSKEINLFRKDILNDLELQRNWGNYILHYGDTGKYGYTDPQKSKLFMDIVEATRTEWERIFIEESNHIISEPVEEFQAKVPSKPGHLKISEFIQRYKRETGIVLGKIVRRDGKYFINYNKDPKTVSRIKVDNLRETGGDDLV